MQRRHRLLPPHLFAFTLVGMIALRFVDGSRPIAPPWNLVGVIPVVAGLAINVSSARWFDHIGTNIVTFDEPGQLVTDRMFRYTRNPMYLGFVLMLVGTAILLGHASAWLGPLAFTAAANWWYIPYEERWLTAKFGASYETYRQRVRRWI